MAAIEALDGGESLFFSHYDPKTVEWFMSILLKSLAEGDTKIGCQKQKDMSIMFAEEKKGEKYLCCMKKSILETVDTEQGIQF